MVPHNERTDGDEISLQAMDPEAPRKGRPRISVILPSNDQAQPLLESSSLQVNLDNNNDGTNLCQA